MISWIGSCVQGICGSWEEAISLFDEKRTLNGRGLTIPSQRRYVESTRLFPVTSPTGPGANWFQPTVKSAGTEECDTSVYGVQICPVLQPLAEPEGRAAAQEAETVDAAPSR
jgi:hypothetical protein